ncbi:MAG: carboxypeptidase regulatory-like domain-containing protein [Acidobacteriota bacterium]
MLRSLSAAAGAALLLCIPAPTSASELAESAVRAELLELDRELHNVVSGARAMGQTGLDEDRLERLGERVDALTARCGAECPDDLLAKQDRLAEVVADLGRGYTPWPAPRTPDLIGEASCSAAPAVRVGDAFSGRRDGTAWVRFEAPRDGFYRVTTAGSRGDSAVAAFSACGGASVASADDTDGLAASISIKAQAGQRFLLEIRGAGGAPVGQIFGGASVGGTVTRSGGAPFENVPVRLYNLDTFSTQNAISEADGSYLFAGLDAGNYAVVTAQSFFSEFFDTAWQDVFCGSSCDPSVATPIVVEAGGAVTGIDLAVARGGQITGRLRESGTASGLVSETVELFDSQGFRQVTDRTDAAGRYRFNGLLPGDYRIATDTDDFRNEVWPNIPCPAGSFCDPLAGDSITVSLDAIADGVDFELDRLGSIAVELTDSLTGLPIQFGQLAVYDAAGNFLSSSSSGLSLGGLETGTYFLTAVSSGYRTKLYEDIPCGNGCTVTDGAPLAVVEGETLTLQMVLDPNGSISGAITEADGGAPAGAEVNVFSVDGLFVGSDFSSMEDGEFRVGNLQPGQYRVYSFSFAYQGESWPEIPCAENCNLVGDLVTVTAGADTGDIDFTLTRFGSISGAVTDDATGDPVTFPNVQVYDATGTPVGNAFNEFDGTYRTTQLPAGTYFVTGFATDYRREVWDDILCPSPCDPTLGTPIVLADGEERENVDFALSRLPFLAGTIREAASGDLIRDAQVQLYNDQGQSIGFDFSFDGRYEFTGLEEGTYYAVAFGEQRHVPLLWDSTPCFQGGCTVLDGTPIVVGPNGATADFLLPLGAILSGSVTATSGAEFPTGVVRIFNADGTTARTGFIGANGLWSVEGLGAGTYFALADPLVHTARLWDGLPCDGGSCDPTAGTPIVATLDNEVTGIDFPVDRLGRISAMLTGVESTTDFGSLLLYNSAGQLISSPSAVLPQSSFVFDGLEVGTYYLGTDRFSRYFDRIFGGEACEPDPCDPTTGTPIQITLGADRSIEFALEPGPGFDIEVFSSIGAPIAGAAVDVWTLDGTLLYTAATDAAGSVTLGIDTGTYLLSTDAGDGFVNQLWQGVPCPDGPAFLGLCDLAPATPVDAITPSALEPVSFVLEAVGVLFGDGFESGDTSAWSALVSP